jgi:hypothetical protein
MAEKEIEIARQLDRKGEDTDVIEAVTKTIEERDSAHLRKLLI